MQTRWHWTLMIAAIATAACIARGQVVENFDNTGDIATNFNITSSNGANTYTAVSNAPPASNNAVEASSGDATATYKSSSFGLLPGYQITASVYVLQQNSTAGSQVLVETGFGDANLDAFHQTTSGYAIYSRLYSINGSNQSFQLLDDNRYIPGTSATELNPESVNLTGSTTTPEWYLFSVTLTNEGSNSYLEAGTVQFVGTNEAAAPSTTLVGSFSQMDVNTGLSGALYSGFRSNIAGGALRIDNFAVSAATLAPEPSSLGILAVTGTLLFRRGPRSRLSQRRSTAHAVAPTTALTPDGRYNKEVAS